MNDETSTLTVTPTVVLRHVQGRTQVAEVDLDEVQGQALLVFGNETRASEFLQEAAADKYPLSGGWRATALDHKRSCFSVKIMALTT